MIVIAAVPFVDTYRPLAAPAVLKSALAKHSIDSVAIDLNVEVMVKVDRHPHKDFFLDFFYQQQINDAIVEDLARMVYHCADRILANRPSTIALSLFCSDCQIFTKWLCAVLRQQAPDCRIVIGGPGLEILTTNYINFPERLKRMGLIDDYIFGDGDQSLVEYVQGNLDYPGINSTSWTTVGKLDDLPLPDYSDYNFYWYQEPSIPIVDSRGCVRQCEFCDVIEIWKKYQYMSADNIFAQMLAQMSRYKITHFDFRSSISNGNLREFKKLLELIADYNRVRVHSEQISWEGSFIIRAINQHPESMWKLLQESNGFLFMGVESIVERVRNGLGKNFTNADIDYHLEMARRYQVPLDLLIIGAYPTETVEDYEFVKQWFIDHKQYANNSIQRVSISRLLITAGTKLLRNAGHYGIEITSPGEWMNTNTNITPEQQQAHIDDLVAVAESQGFNVNAK